MAGLAGVPGAELLARILKGASESADAADQTVSVETLRKDIVEQLSEIGHRIIVIIDDLDRLEPAEAVEITRLIRAVADFPNIVYVLCYDRVILARSLQIALSIENGHAYLDKIVQVSFRVPQPEAFDLRRWLFEDCIRLYSATTSSALDEDATAQLSTACDLEGGSIDTPRDVVQILNAVKLYWPPIKDDSYFPGLVWLKIINVKDVYFYHWI